MSWLAVLAGLLILLGVILSRRGASSRLERGLSQGNTLALDTRTFYSARHKLAGRPDRLFRDGEAIIPEEWKKSLRVYDSHRVQLGTYLILIEEETGVAPPYGVIVLGDGSRVTVQNTLELREWVLGVAEQIRLARGRMSSIIPVEPPPAKCRACGMRPQCTQARC